jgi:hypothetical protein
MSDRDEIKVTSKYSDISHVPDCINSTAAYRESTYFHLSNYPPIFNLLSNKKPNAHLIILWISELLVNINLHSMQPHLLYRQEINEFPRSHVK